MKSKLTDEIKVLISQSIDWAKLEVEYIKLTAAEKLIVLMSTMIIALGMLLLLLPVIIMFLFALEGVFEMWMPEPLAFLAVGGVLLVILILVFLLRKPLIINPVSRFITKTILEKRSDKH